MEFPMAESTIRKAGLKIDQIVRVPSEKTPAGIVVGQGLHLGRASWWGIRCGCMSRRAELPAMSPHLKTDARPVALVAETHRLTTAR